MYLCPISVSFFSASASVVMATRVMVISCGRMGSMLLGKAQLHWPAHLAAVERALDKGGHHRAEGADVKKVLAHKVPNFPIKLGVVLFGGLQVLAHPQILQRLRVAALQGNLIP